MVREREKPKREYTITVEDAAEAVGVTVRQMRRRIARARRLLRHHTRRGANNRLLFDAEAVEILLALEQRCQCGYTFADALACVERDGASHETRFPKAGEVVSYLARSLKAKDEIARMTLVELRAAVANSLGLRPPVPHTTMLEWLAMGGRRAVRRSRSGEDVGVEVGQWPTDANDATDLLDEALEFVAEYEVHLWRDTVGFWNAQWRDEEQCVVGPVFTSATLARTITEAFLFIVRREGGGDAIAESD